MTHYQQLFAIALFASCSGPTAQTNSFEPEPWYEVISQRPGNEVTDPTRRQQIVASGHPWKVRDRITGIEMIFVLPGEFLMGSAESEPGRFANEGPRHRVRLSQGYYLGATEVTQREWQDLMGPSPNFFDGDNLPRDVSLELVHAYLKQANESLPAGQKILRLPTEAEWEYACRAGTSGPFHFAQPATHDLLNFCDGDAESARVVDGELLVKWRTPPSPECPVSTVPAGSLPPNPWGFHEMHGNLLELCADKYTPEGYSVPDANQITMDPFEEPIGDDLRTLRGGSWYDSARYCRSSVRDGAGTFVRSNRIGFRVARTL